MRVYSTMGASREPSSKRGAAAAGCTGALDVLGSPPFVSLGPASFLPSLGSATVGSGSFVSEPPSPFGIATKTSWKEVETAGRVLGSSRADMPRSDIGESADESADACVMLAHVGKASWAGWPLTHTGAGSACMAMPFSSDAREG